MRYNPCGYIVDWARVAYKTKCRFFRDDDRINTVRWAEASEDALTLPFESVICNAFNEIDHCLDAPVGEVFGASRPYTGQSAPVGLFSGHFCGTEQDFAEGGKYEPDKPPVPYGAAGFPLCCNPVLVARGGAGAGGLARLVVGKMVDPTAGGMEIGGEVGDRITFTDATEGGMEIGGEVGDVLTYTDATEGGMEIGGEVGDVLTYTDATEGGMEIGGEAGDVFAPPVVPFCDTYDLLDVPTVVSSLNTGGVDQEIWPDAIHQWVLYSPIFTGTNWLLVDTATGVEWEPLGTWDGTGTRTFSEIGGVSFQRVESECV